MPVSEESRVHIIGAGVAGLAAAVHLSQQGHRISLYEAAPRAGGRCRSYHDPQLDCVIDNGNHLMMSGNHAVMSYLESIDAADRLIGPPHADYPFIDVATNERWSLRPSAGRMPWWIFNAHRRVPHTTPWDYLSALRILKSDAHETVADCVGTEGPLYRRFWEPLTVAALNTDPRQASAQLMQPVLTETFLRGSHACRPLIARRSLADTLIEPAVQVLTAAGADIRYGTRIKALAYTNDLVCSLEMDGENVAVAPTDVVILATPPWIAETLIPGLNVPPPGEPIVNVHYRLASAIGGDEVVRIVGVIGGTAHWVFARGDLASVTISAAADLVDTSADDIASACWPDVAAALNLEGDKAPSRVVKERRATFAQSPDALALRSKTATNCANLLLAGDWTATGVPATIEGAVRSGFQAATLASKCHGVVTSLSPTYSARKQIEAA